MPSAELNRVIEQLRVHPIDHNASVETLRNTFVETPPLDGTTIIPVDAGGVAAEWVMAGQADPDQRLLYLHGGGYVICNPDTHRELAGRISTAAGVAVLVLDYRLAPEHPYPAALNDALTALKWLYDYGPHDMGPAQKTFIAGDSAGGGLTLAALIAARDARMRLPDRAVTLSAWTDLACTGATIRTRADSDPMISEALLRRLAREYLQGQAAPQPLVSPLYADFHGLPPLLMQVGDAEVLLDDTTRVAEKAKAAGVDVTLEVYPEMIHIFQYFAAVLPKGQHAINQIGAFINR